jgi:hypothetical protein
MQSGARGLLIGGILIARVAIGVLKGRQEPVPVQEGHVIVLTGRRMPPEQMIVMRADLASGVMVANVVIVDLGKRDADQAEGQKDPEQS